MTDNTEYVAIGPYCWGRSKHDPETALINAIRSFSPSMMKDQSKPVPFTILEVTGEWTISDFSGAVTAEKIETVAKEIPVTMRMRDAVEDLWDKLSEAIMDRPSAEAETEAA